jgi:hypothetical protein
MEYPHIKLDTAITLLFLFSCAQPTEALRELDTVAAINAVSGVNLSFCTDPPVDPKYALKTIIVLDHSASNKDNYRMNPDGTPVIIPGVGTKPSSIDSGPKYATDPNGRFRYGDVNEEGTLLNFLDKTPRNNPLNPSRYFALVNFNDVAATFPENETGFTWDIDRFYQKVLDDSRSGGTPSGPRAPTDTGSTRYIKGTVAEPTGSVNAIYNIMSADIATAKYCAGLPANTSASEACPQPGVVVTSTYVIVFLSDGAPITQIRGLAVDPETGKIILTGTQSDVQLVRQRDNDILAEVSAIMGLNSDRKYVAGINLFTVYYYLATNPDNSAKKLLADMAKIGNGLSYDAVVTSSSKIDYTRFVPATKKIRYSFSNVFITNSSTTWWDDGQFHVDSDTDGLPDDVEEEWGSDPDDKFSNGQGVSDLVLYRLVGGESIPASVDYSFGACAAVGRTYPAGKIQYNSSDPNGLNDCEKLLLNTIVGKPDSNSDAIPDWLEFKNNIPFQLGTTPAQNDPFLEGLSISERIQKSLPVNFSTEQLDRVQPANYDITLVSQSATKSCYNYVVPDIPRVGPTDKIRIDIIFKSDEVLEDSYLYRSAEKNFKPGEEAIVFSDWKNPNPDDVGRWKIWQ